MTTQPSFIDYLPMVITILGTVVGLIIGVNLATKIIKVVVVAFKEPPLPEGVEKIKISVKKAAGFAVLNSVSVFLCFIVIGVMAAAISSRINTHPLLPIAFVAFAVFTYILIMSFMIGCAIQAESEWIKRARSTKEATE